MAGSLTLETERRFQMPIAGNDPSRVWRDYLLRKGLPLDVAVTFQDVLIVDQTSAIGSRADITNLQTQFCRNLRLNIPIVSANMVDVTESRMAILLARLGGCGFIHQFAPIEKRMEEVKRVKRADNEIIENPWLIRETDLLSRAITFMAEKQTSGVLVVDEDGKLVGILTDRDIRFRHLWTRSIGTMLVRDVMSKEEALVCEKPNVSIDTAVFILESHKIEKLPLIDDDGKPVGLITAKDILKKTEFPNAVRDKKGRLIVGATIGVTKDFLEEAAYLVEAGADVILVDTARANSYRAYDVVSGIRREFQYLQIVAGNIDNPEGTSLLIKAGADCIKVGIGPGSACKTRVETGIGVPQITAIAECSAVAQKAGITVIADGGIKSGGDLAKAIVAGADCVMTGGLLAGTEETPGEVHFDDGHNFKIYRGSAAFDAQFSRMEHGGLDRLRASEGITRRVAFKGQSADKVIGTLIDNLRSAMSYANASDIPALKNAKFRIQSHFGYLEGHPEG